MSCVLTWSLRIVACVAVLLILIAGSLSTQFGQRAVISMASYVASSPNMLITIGKLEGSLFSSVNVDRVTVADRNGTWLQVSNIALSWAPLSLFGGHINIEQLTVAAIELRRQPAGKKQATETSNNASTPMMRFTLGRLQVNELILREGIIGTAARFAISASANLADHRKGLTANLAVKRLDKLGAKIRANLNYGGPNQNLSVQLAASEPADGLVANILQIPQRPPMALQFTGDGTLDAWQANWSMRASARPFVAGRIRLDRDGKRYRLATDFAGYVQTIVPQAISGLLAGKTTGSLIGHFTNLERVDVSHLLLSADAFKMRAKGAFERSTSYVHGALSLAVGRRDQQPVEIALSDDQQLSIRKLDAKLSLPDKRAAREVSLTLLAQGLAHPLAAVSTISLSGRGKQSMPLRSNTFDAEKVDVRLSANGFTSSVDGLAEVLGDQLQLVMDGSVKSGALTIKKFELGDSILKLVGDGIISAEKQSGKARLSISDIKRFSTLFGETLAGRLNISSTISANLNRGGLKFAFNGAADNLNLGKSAAAGLLGNELKLSGVLMRDAVGTISLQDIVATGNNLAIALDGRYDEKAIELSHTIDIADLSAVLPDLAGAAKLEVKLNGTPDILKSRLRCTTQKMSWRGKAVKDLTLRFSGNGPLSAHAGQFEIAGRVDEQPVVATALLTLSRAGWFDAQDVSLQIGRNTLAGHIRLGSNVAPSGNFKLKAFHLSDLDVLLGQDISGAFSGELEFSGDRRASLLRLNARASKISIAGSRLRQLKAQVALHNLMTNISGQASITLAGLTSANSIAHNFSLALRASDGRLAFVGKGQVNKAAVSVSGSAKRQRDSLDVLIDRASTKRGALNVRLAKRAQLAITNNGVRIAQLGLLTGRGSVSVSGEATSAALGLEVKLTRVPTNIANVFVPALGLEGAVSGRAQLSGSLKNPTAKIDAIWKQATAQVLRDNHVPPVTVKLNGDLRDSNVKARIDIRGPQALALSINGDAKLKPAQDMRFQLSGGIPLQLANAALAARATQVAGRAKIFGIVNGKPGKPNIDIKIEIPGATIQDPSSGIQIQRLAGILEITERGVKIQKVTGRSALGGTLSVSGAVVLAEKETPQINIKVQLDRFRFNDRKIMAGEVDGRITLAGAMDAIAARGNVYLRRLDVTVPAAAPGALTTLNVKHVNAPKHLIKADPREIRPASRSSKSSVLLDLRIDAANRMFVKGRGVDAQLGGGLTIRGTSDALVTDGAFEMRRGRLDILGRRLDFRRGRILFDGSAEPVLDMEAIAVADDVTIIVTISGWASKPVFKFSSTPELPEDEVIARLLFNKALVGLSPLQLVQLASEVDKLGGLSSGPGILDKLKRSVGVDVLNISTDKTGAATVSAGRYVTDKTFVGLRQGATAGSSRVIIDHDFTKNLKARGEVGADGNSKLGIGLEWDY